MSVVVSAYNRAYLLAGLVAALQAQTMPDFEAVLVDNGSTDDTHAELQRLTADDPRFRVVRIDDNRGPARARNLAWRMASAPWIAFTDDDCAPDPRWLEALLHAAETADFVQGRTVWATYEPTDRPRWFDRAQRIERWSGRYETCNLLISRSVLERHDGFNEQFRIAMGEDTDLGLRATAAGAATGFAHDAVVAHHIWPCGFRDYLHQRRRYSELVELMGVNPAARGLLAGGYVLRGVHLLIWGLIPLTVVSLVAGVPWLPLVVIGAWVVLNTYRTRRRPFPAWQRLGYSAVHLVGYAYETVCFAAASVRYRSLVI
ncbi:MAG: glycosyltransferase family 2 protein [Acidimicrobiales bacterium]